MVAIIVGNFIQNDMRNIKVNAAKAKHMTTSKDGENHEHTQHQREHPYRHCDLHEHGL